MKSRKPKSLRALDGAAGGEELAITGDFGTMRIQPVSDANATVRKSVVRTPRTHWRLATMKCLLCLRMLITVCHIEAIIEADIHVNAACAASSFAMPRQK